MRRSSAARRDAFARIAPHYDALMASVPYDWWAEYVSRLALLSGRPIFQGNRLLDLATGTGSVALEFAARGCVVTGLDLSQPMLVQARRKAAARGLQAQFICADLRQFHLPPEFDHAVCLYDSLNYVLESEGLKRAFACIHSALKPQGLLIFDVNTVHALETELFTQRSSEGAQVRYRWQSKYDRTSRISRIRMHFELPATGERFDVLHRQRAYTDAELRSFLHHAGFADIRGYDAYRLTPPGPTSDRVFYVASAANQTQQA